MKDAQAPARALPPPKPFAIIGGDLAEAVGQFFRIAICRLTIGYMERKVGG